MENHQPKQRKTFEELIYESPISVYLDDEHMIIALMHQVRQATLKEAAEKAEVDYSKVDEPFNVWVNKDTILNLDPNSIETP